jgi:hypothetical protein
MTGHEKDLTCQCSKCCDEFLGIKSSDLKNSNQLLEMRARKLLELAEQEGGLKEFINDTLEGLPNYNKICRCDESVKYDMDLGDNKHRDVCLRCAGRISGNGTLEKCPRCDSDDISAGEWNGAKNFASCSVTCNKCDCSWTETFTIPSWELN